MQNHNRKELVYIKKNPSGQPKETSTASEPKIEEAQTITGSSFFCKWRLKRILRKCFKSFLEWLKGFSKPDVFVNVILAFLTLWTLFLMRQTLDTMATDRESAYRPRLAIDTQEISIYFTEPNDLDVYPYYRISYYIDHKIRDELSRLEEIDVPPLLLRIKNIGFGIAQNVHCEWDTSGNYKQFLKIIDGFRSHNFLLKDEYSKISIFGRSFHTDCYISNAYTQYLKTNDNESFILVDATAYLYIHTQLLQVDDFRSDIQPVRLKITYEDVFGKPYEQNIVVFFKNKGRFFMDESSLHGIQYNVYAMEK